MRIVQNNLFQKSVNELLVLRELRKGPLSRVKLASLLGLQQSTVTYCTSRLTEAGLIRLTGNKISQRGAGRKPELLAVNPDAGRIIGVEMLRGSYRMSICDILGNLISSDVSLYDDVSSSTQEEMFRARVDTIVGRVLSRCEGTDVWGMCIAVPGIVSLDGKKIIDCWTHGLRECDFSGFLSSFSFPIVFENDANCCALKYVIHGSDIEDDTFLYVRFQSYDGLVLPPGIPSIGIGTGLVLAGKLYRGYRGRGGEFRSVYTSTASGATQLSFSHEELARRHEDPMIMESIVKELLENMMSIRALLDPRTIYLGGFDETERQFLIAGLHEFSDSDETAGFVDSCVIINKAEDDASLGAASLVVDEVFRIPRLGERSDKNTINWMSRAIEDS
ncbi:ROK family transcriptional regulator [Parasphaerochaeta coccoides]|uniref:ROK family protein n=1 Tax=Parasphaerochaeta coccoides (strain ATCC BAA-1237 / DSM 17374 / SPN1) TaxID=760011 RepID=F4GHI0_PARC1|nr:ROK family transcriptional regulator [Parasphaerochaeta coccoides]AEC02569.1 ROK family protein [Parasphaerochaeta coccoides DSM 17374]